MKAPQSNNNQQRHFTLPQRLWGYRGFALLTLLMIGFSQLLALLPAWLFIATFGAFLVTVSFNRPLLFRTVHFLNAPGRRGLADKEFEARIRKLAAFLIAWGNDAKIGNAADGGSIDMVLLTAKLSEKTVSTLIEIELHVVLDFEQHKLPQDALNVAWEILDPKDDPRWLHPQAEALTRFASDTHYQETFSMHERLEATALVLDLKNRAQC
jgi:hypothetical protein